MQTKLLIDAITRQTTVLIAQLSSAAGIRAPLAHLADEVFLHLSEELEEQGLSKKVVADMFGMALRGYQRRVQRLRESATEHGRTLWEAILDHLQREGPTSRLQLLDRFDSDDPEAVAAMLNDLVSTGLATRTGSGSTAVFSVTPEESRRVLAEGGHDHLAGALVWLDLCRNPGAQPEDIAGRLGVEPQVVAEATRRLVKQGSAQVANDGGLQTEALIIDVGSEEGWETAVLDHYQAVCAAIASKLQKGTTRSAAADTTGGMTLNFEISETHPLHDRVLGLLRSTREEVDALWDEVEAINQEHPLPEEEVKRVTFYFGQSVKENEEP